MIDISNKLHAMVDEFVSNLSSKCVNLANNVSGESHQFVAADSTPSDPKTPRSSNRTTSEVLSGLKRPSITPLASSHQREGKSHMQHAKSNLQTGHIKNREEGRNLRSMNDPKAKSAALQVLEDLHDNNGVDSDIDATLSRDSENRGGTTTRMAAKGRVNQTVELLSSDSVSDDCPRRRPKFPARNRGTQRFSKGRASTSQGRSRRIETRSPSESPESSHNLDYGYEEDTPSFVGTSPRGDMVSPKLRWPEDIEGSHLNGGTGKKLDYDDVQDHTENLNMQERLNDDVDITLEEDAEPLGEDTGRHPIPAESDGEELPVLPKVPVKRKVMNEPRICERRTQRGRATSGSPQTKKQRTPQIDASVITQLVFGRRPQNCVSVPTSYL